MVVKEQWRISGSIRSCKARHGAPNMIIRLPIAGADRKQYPGADLSVLAAVYCLDGKAVVRPSTLRCGILVCEWTKFMRFIRRHNLA